MGTHLPAKFQVSSITVTSFRREGGGGNPAPSPQNKPLKSLPRLWLRKIFIKGPKYREVRPINLKKAKCCILEGLDNCIILSLW